MVPKQNFEDYKKKLEARGKLIVPAVASNADITEWVRILIKDVMTSPMEDEKPKDEKKKLEKKLAQNDKNPYVRAREELLSKSKILRTDIERMEREGNTSTRIYLDFVAQVKTLGDKLSQ